MKKLLPVLLAGVLSLSLISCGEKEPSPFDPATAGELLKGTAFSEALTEIAQSAACALYGIDEATVTASAVYGSAGATAEELAIFTFSTPEDAQTAAKQLGYRVEDRTEDLRSYLPNEIPKLEKAVVEVRGSSALLVIAADYGPVDAYLEGEGTP